MLDIFILYSTFPTRDEAFLVAEKLLENKLIACANVQEGVTSLYRWEGEMKRENEFVMLAKTQHKKLQAASELIKSLHSHSIPCIVAYPVAGGFPPFLEWVAKETQ